MDHLTISNLYLSQGKGQKQVSLKLRKVLVPLQLLGGKVSP